jgi:hypothetical protein
MVSPSRFLPILPVLATLCVQSPAAGQGCSVPGTYTNRTTLAVGNLLVTLATEQQTYLVGDSVHFWLSFENTGSTTLTIPNPSMITPMDALLVLPATCDSLDEPGCFDALLFRYPQGFYYFGAPVVLNPGACAVYEHVWDGVPAFGHTIHPGLHTVFGGMITYPGEFHVPVGGMRLPIQIQSTSTVPVVPATWGRIKAKY